MDTAAASLRYVIVPATPTHNPDAETRIDKLRNANGALATVLREAVAFGNAVQHGREPTPWLVEARAALELNDSTVK